MGSHQNKSEVKVLKFGGSSLSSLKHIRRCALIVEQTVLGGFAVVVVVSAMGNYTDSLIDYIEAFEVQDCDSSDVVLSAGEQISCGLLTLALKERGLDAISLMGWQLPIETDDVHSGAKIKSICIDKVSNALHNRQIVVVAGFQGVHSGRMTTLGRGGSDITATALAKALDAVSCEIYTDVGGVFSMDPRKHQEAQHLEKISYAQLLEMSLGEHVLHCRALDIARKNIGTVLIKSSFDQSASAQTQIVKDIEELHTFGLSFKEDRMMLKADKHFLFRFLKNTNIEPDSVLVMDDNASVIISASDCDNMQLPGNFEGVNKLGLVTIVGSSFLTNIENLNRILGTLESSEIKYLLTTEIKIVIAVSSENFTSTKENIINTLNQISHLEESVKQVVNT